MVYEFSNRLRKKLPEGYEDKIAVLDLPKVKEEMYRLQRNIATAQKDMADDIKVEDAKNSLTDEEAPYKDTINGAKLMIKFLNHTIDDNGW